MGRWTGLLAAALAGASLACGRGDPGGGVAAATPEAADAGAAILARGGNAVDAAVAVAFALAVTEPAMSGLGGQTQILIARSGTAPVVVNGTSFAPVAIPADVSAGDVTGHRATTVPTSVKALAYAWRRFGSGAIGWRDLLAPAIRLAGEGFVVGPFRHRVWARHADGLHANDATRTLFLDADGAVPAEGARFVQPVLARTLRRLREAGPEDFYRGEIARQIAADMAAHGGWITLDDLRGLGDPVEVAPLEGSYRGWTVYTAPPPAGGWQVLLLLNLFETWPAESLAPDAPRRAVRLARALRLAHGERRARPIRDPADYADDVAAKLDKHAARRMLEGRGETTHFTVADGDGMVVSVTASINAYFGARVAAPTLGFLYNDYMHEFVLGDPAHPYALRPGGVPYSSMSPTVLVRDGVPVLGLGSPGSARIVSAVAQVIQLWADAGLTLAEAVAAPRLHVVPDSLLLLEAPELPLRARATLERMGFVFGAPRADLALGGRNAYFGGVHAVARRDGRWEGAADPRRDGVVRWARR